MNLIEVDRLPEGAEAPNPPDPYRDPSGEMAEAQTFWVGSDDDGWETYEKVTWLDGRERVFRLDDE